MAFLKDKKMGVLKVVKGTIMGGTFGRRGRAPIFRASSEGGGRLFFAHPWRGGAYFLRTKNQNAPPPSSY